ncbi:cupin domain-containing protein [Neoroseomonas soli]|uniref:Cupin domain-containing protein n=1 Tax=Neoroseomonas soli TaxID=1081025 RepID=A0A9X9WU41_9PROT|nr:cupin domain-containing protein [Neoroseomonas soli]MBR0670670.1 cupin domain-containing protein [Neoroseomonas soli]
MSDAKPPIAVVAAAMPPRARPSGYPKDLVGKIGGRVKTVLGDVFGLKNFGVNLTRLPPGSASALRHAHEKQDEFVYILEGECVLVTNAGETPMKPGMCAGFRAGTGDAHHLVNRGAAECVYLEVGDRTLFEKVEYPDDDLMILPGPDGKSVYYRKDGTPLF